jgi:hypothetical protein
MHELMTMRQRRSGHSSATHLVSCLLLVVLFLQATPFVIPFAHPAEEPADKVSQYFEPLQVCGDLQGPGILLADIPWIPPSPQAIPSLPESVSFFATAGQSCREGFSPSPYRPPRHLIPLS